MNITPKTVLCIGKMWPEPTSSAAGVRILQLIAYFLEQNYQVVFASAAKKGATMELPDKVVQQDIVLNADSFDVFVKDLQPDIVLFDRFTTEEQFGWRVQEQAPNALQLLDTEDFHSLRQARKKAFAAQEDFTMAHVFAHENTKREIAAMYRTDLVLVISDYEKQVLIEDFKFPEALIHSIPFMVDAPVCSTLSYQKREGFSTIGNFLHPPNKDAVAYLKKTIWPLLSKENKKVNMHVYGAYPDAGSLQFTNAKTRFYVHGFTPDASLAIEKSRVCLAALRYGAGQKGKLITAMQSGTPFITTSIGAEAMQIPEDYIADSPKEFVEKATRLYTDPMFWQQSQAIGYTILKTHFSKERHYPVFTQKIQQARQLKNTPGFNFIGQMLRHHTMQSTKYLSRWIQQKNQKQ